MLRVKKCASCKFIFIDSRGRSKCDPCYESSPTSSNQPITPPTVPPIFNSNQHSQAYMLAVMPIAPLSVLPINNINSYHQALPFSAINTMHQQHALIPPHIPFNMQQNIPIPRQSMTHMHQGYQK